MNWTMRPDAAEHALADLLVGDLDAERSLQLEDDLERVDRIETEALIEQRHVVHDFFRLDRHPETAHDRGLHLIGEGVLQVHMVRPPSE